MKENILKEFISKKEIFEAFKERVINLISDLLRQEALIIHHITGRTKNYESLSKKIDRKSGKYNSLDDITDLVGIRIISYLESDVDRIASIIRKEFTVDEENSVDKRDLNIDQFGYKSLHLVVLLNDARGRLAEYKEYKAIKCEIQIRSILQHAWAEIEHDLGYKGKLSIPDQYKRNFNRLAALLETADIEFDRLKQDLSRYENEVSELIQKSPELVQINKASLVKFNLENAILIECRKLMSDLKNWVYKSDTDFLEGMTENFHFFKLYTIKDIEVSLQNNKQLFFEFVREFIKDINYSEISFFIALYYFTHFLAGKTQSVEDIFSYFDYSPIKIASINGFAEELIELYREAELVVKQRTT